VDRKNREKYDNYFRIVLDTYIKGHNLFNYDSERLAESVLMKRI
jgi:hypothetical protein